jgi:hypothetical protein
MKSSIRFKNVRSDWSYECTPNTVNVFETGITLPGRSEVSQAATTPCRLQLRAVLESSASKLSGRYCTSVVASDSEFRFAFPTASESSQSPSY